MTMFSPSRPCRCTRVGDVHPVIPAGTEIGTDFEQDRERYFVSDDDIVVVQRGSLSIAGPSLVHETAHPYRAEM